MNAYETLKALEHALRISTNMWDRQKLLANFYDTGALSSVVIELAATHEPPAPEPQKCSCGEPAEYLVTVLSTDTETKHCPGCVMELLSVGAQFTVKKLWKEA